MRRIIATASVAAAFALLLSGCSTGTPEDCLTAKPDAIAKLWADISSTVPGAERLGVGVAPSENSDMTFIAVKFNDGSGDYTGTWATTQDPTKDDDVAFIAVDGVAKVSGTYQQPTDFEGKTFPAARTAAECIG